MLKPLALVAYILFSLNCASAQTPFYQGKTITIVQGTEPGGSSDVQTRALLPYLKKHIPGEPTIVSEYMPGSGGKKPPTMFSRMFAPTVLPWAASAAV